MSTRILIGDALTRLREMPERSVNCCVTSPPYFGLRDYNVAGQIGLEDTPAEYVARLVGVFEEVRRVLRDDGTLWLNLGDSYAGSWGAQSHRITDSDDVRWHGSQIKNHPKRASRTGSIRQAGLKPKDLIGIPWAVAFALRDAGWYLRSDIIWHKVAPMPESVHDRPTRSHEHVFLLSKVGQYFYNRASARDPLRPNSVARLTQPNYESQEGSDRVPGKTNGKMKAVAARFGGRIKSKINDQTRLASGNEWSPSPESGANWRDVWPLAHEGSSEAHFATMPAELAERCLLAGCPSGGVVLDPFLGAGTTALAADRLGLDCIGIELNPDYAAMAQRRIESDAGMFAATERVT